MADAERSWPRRLLTRAALPTSGLLALAVAAAYPAQRLMLFPAPRPVRQPAVAASELVTIARPSGPVYAAYFPAEAGAPTIVHFHGNGEQLADVVPFARALHARGFGVVAAEYPGYGLAASQSPSERALYDAAEAVVAHLRDAWSIPLSSIVLSGHSLGTGVATEMAKRGLGAKLVLSAPYTSIADMAGVLVPFLPARYLVRDRFDNVAKAPEVKQPTLIVHGTKDDLIPFAMGQRLAGVFPDARLVPIDGGHHNDLFASFRRELIGAIGRFVAE